MGTRTNLIHGVQGIAMVTIPASVPLDVRKGNLRARDICCGANTFL